MDGCRTSHPAQCGANSCLLHPRRTWHVVRGWVGALPHLSLRAPRPGSVYPPIAMSPAQLHLGTRILLLICVELTCVSSASGKDKWKCDFEQNVDFASGKQEQPPGWPKLNIPAQEACCQLCAQQSGCAAGVWDPVQKAC